MCYVCECFFAAEAIDTAIGQINDAYANPDLDEDELFAEIDELDLMACYYEAVLRDFGGPIADLLGYQ